jgi:hypothetical protein
MKLMNDSDWGVRSSAIQHASVPLRILDGLVNNDLWYVRVAVVKNPNVSKDILIKLASDRESIVRRKIANKCTDSEILIKLASDLDCDVRVAVLYNVAVPKEALEILLLNPDIHDEVIEVLIKKNKKRTSP